MWFWWMMFAFNLLVPAIMILSGRMMWKHCPEEINTAFGYRTKRSMQNMETWKFSHDYCGRLWWKAGWILAVLSVLVQIPFFKSDRDAIGYMSLVIMTVQCAILLLSIIPTELALKKEFNNSK